MSQVLVLVGERPNQRPLKLGEEPVLGARGIRAVEVLFPVEDVDVRPREPDLQQGLDGSLSMLRVDDGAHHAIGWIRDEGVCLLHVASHKQRESGSIIHDLETSAIDVSKSAHGLSCAARLPGVSGSRSRDTLAP